MGSEEGIELTHGLAFQIRTLGYSFLWECGLRLFNRDRGTGYYRERLRGTAEQQASKGQT